MENPSSFKNFVFKMASSGFSMPGMPLVFLLVAIISFLQLPANLIIRSFSLSAGILINEFLIIAGIPILVVYLFHFDRSRLFPFSKPGLNILVKAVFMTLAVALLIDYSAKAGEYFFPIPAQYRETLDRLMAFGNVHEFIWKLFLLSIVPGICEEIFFRGFCQNAFEARWGVTISVIMTAVLFAILHGNPWYMHLYLLLGLFLSWIYAMSRTLWIPIICHVVNNAWTFINHTLGIEYPLYGFNRIPDILIMSGAALFVVIIGLNIYNKRTTVNA